MALTFFMGTEVSWAERQSTNPDPMKNPQADNNSSNCQAVNDGRTGCRKVKSDKELAISQSAKNVPADVTDLHIGGVKGKRGDYSSLKPGAHKKNKSQKK